MFIRALAAAVSVALVTMSAHAAVVVDQEQDNANLGLPFGFDFDGYPHQANLPIGQSFTAGMDGVLSAVQVMSTGIIVTFDGRPTEAQFVMDIHAGDGTRGALLGSVTQTKMCDFSFGGCGLSFDLSRLGISLTKGAQYTFDFTSISGPPSFWDTGLTMQTGNPYHGGAALPGPGYANTGDWDLTFRTLVAAPVPEPFESTLLLAGLGLVGTMLCRRRG